jgi:polar amino acid transport system substrate-binding protein
MGYRNEDNEIVGFDIDLAKEVCARLGVELKLQPIDWATKELELDAGNIDCIWNGMSYTDERAEIAALSMNYMYNAMVLLVKDPAYQTKEDLAGKVVGVQAGSYAEELLTQGEDYAEYLGSLKEVLSYPTYLLAIMDLQNGNADAVFIDLVVADYITTSLGDDSLFTMGNMEDDIFCIGFRKDDLALRDAVNEALMAMAADGTMEEICVKWFGSNVSLISAE